MKTLPLMGKLLFTTNQESSSAQLRIGFGAYEVVHCYLLSLNKVRVSKPHTTAVYSNKVI